MSLRKLLYVVLFNVKIEHFCNSERVPNERSTSQFVVEGIRPIDYRSKFNYVGIQNIVSDLSTDMQQNLEISLAEAFLVVDELSQLNETDPENIMRNIHLEDLSNVVHDCLCIKVFIDILRRSLVFVLAQQNCLEDGQSLCPYLPPRIFN